MKKLKTRKLNLTVPLALALLISSTAACAQNKSGAGALSATVSAQSAPSQSAPAQNSVPRREFIAVEGANLKAKIDAAVRLARSGSRRTNFWTAYTFDVRPGVAVDVQFDNGYGTTFVNGVSVSFDSKYESGNVGIFLLQRQDGGGVAEVAIYDLSRRREYRGYPVYWMGHAGNEESLSLLTNLTQSGEADKVAERAALAVAIHDDARVPGILKNFVRGDSSIEVRKASALWLGHFTEERAFLTALARDERENVEVRKHAVLGVGMGKDLAVIETLRGIYEGTTNGEVREHVFVALSGNEHEDAAVELLIKIARGEKDREARKKAIFWLGQKAGERSLTFLKDTLDSSDADTEIQKQAVFALSQKPRDEAIPTLIRVARTHRSGEVRKQAIFWLGQIADDDRALAFFEEILKK